MAKKSRQKDSYQVTNWSAYNKSLVNRGAITFWFSEESACQLEARKQGLQSWTAFCLSRRSH